MAADLHSHSTCSDGTESPRHVVRAAAAAGLDVIALTDHDTAQGWAEARAAADEVGVRLLPGIEVSTTRAGASFHLLAYHVDPDMPWLAAELERARSSRVSRARRMVERIARDYAITWPQVQRLRPRGATVGRPHIADALVAIGAFRNRDEVFADVLATGSRYHVGHYALDVASAVRAVSEAGGVSVLAHGLAARQGRRLDEELLEELVDAGLDGLEVMHRDHGENDRQTLLRWARRHDLIVTGGSDYHGAGKRNRLGENVTADEELARVDAGRG